jgi:sigma-B regulation protein RsbU (phosphoserine phosphatase)
MKTYNPIPLRILVVDDQAMQRLIVRRTLQRLGHLVVEAFSGDEALHVLGREPVDLVISDWVMDGMDGVELCRTLRERSDLPYVYFILMSSRDTREDLLAGLNAGADDFLRKPLDFDELAVRLRSGQRLLALQSSLNERNTLLIDALSRIDADIHAAAEFQKGMLPSVSLDSTRSGFEWLFLPSASVSGDAINCFRLDEHHIGFYNVDVAGHGIASALVGMLMTQSLDPRSSGCVLRRTDADGQVHITPPAEAVAALNRQMTSLELGSNYLTCSYGVLDERCGEVVLVRAGHTMPVIVRADGAAAVLDDDGDMPVGLFDSADYHHIHLHLSPGDRLCLYSDGITESESADEIEYGVERLAEFLRNAISWPLAEVIGQFKDEMQRWSGNASEAFKDDVSMLVIEYVNGTGTSPAF